MCLNRKIDNTLVEWKNDPRHKPLLMRGAPTCRAPAKARPRDYRLKRFELKTENRSRNNGSGQRFIASNGNSRHPTAEFKVNQQTLVYSVKQFIWACIVS